MKEAVFKIIQEITDEKKKSKSLFLVASDIEISRAVRKEVLQCLRELWKEDRIDFGRSVNHNYVEIRIDPKKPRRRKVILHKIHL